MDTTKRKSWPPAITVIVIFGFISLLGDMVYESARSANSQYFSLIGIDAAKVGLVFGIGEFLGYFLRLFAGLWSDKSHRHWLFIFVGYGMLAVVPLMGLTMRWNMLIVLILMERIGKSLRSPAKDTILSGVAEGEVGTGFAFGLQEALDQVGAFAGPMIFTLLFLITGRHAVTEYQTGYTLLFVPYAALMAFLVFAFRKVKRYGLVPQPKNAGFHSEKLRPVFWIYTAFTFFSTLGFVNFSLIGFHLKTRRLLSDADITLVYALAMAVDALVALIIGKLYDRIKIKSGDKAGGLATLLVLPILSAALPLCALSDSVPFILAGMALFGVIMGIHETVMRSAIADITPFYKRGTGYGLFNTGYGLALMLGAAVMGRLYDIKASGAIVLLVCLSQVIALGLFVWLRKAAPATQNA